MLYCPTTGDLVVEDVTGGAFGSDGPGTAFAVIVDIETGQEKARVDTTAVAGAGMWL